MKTLIVYATKYGCTTECVDKLKEQIPGGADALNIAKSKPDLKEYDNVIIGGSIYMGQLNSKLKTFVENNTDTLLGKKLGMFLVCGSQEKFDETAANAFPKALLKHAQVVECFGGEFNVDRMGFWHRKIVNMIGKETDLSTVKVIPENITKLANAMAVGK